MQGNYTTKSAAETVSLGEKFGQTLKGGELILLYGELGGGKTQFTKGIAKSLGITETVVSPTFTIERIYQGAINNQQSTSLRGTKQSFSDPEYQLHHFDLYRTDNDRELYQEVQDLLLDKRNVIVIEWPENMKSLIGLEATKITFKYVNDNERLITIGGAE